MSTVPDRVPQDIVLVFKWASRTVELHHGNIRVTLTREQSARVIGAVADIIEPIAEGGQS